MPSAAFAGLVALVVPVALGRTAPPLSEARAARFELDRAREAGAATWSAAELERAEAVFDDARTEQRRQELRFVSFRDFTEARVRFAEAESCGREAREAAEERKRTARQDAREAVRKGGAGLEEAERMAERVRLSPAARQALGKARILVAEAGKRLAAGDFPGASQKARLGSAELETVLAHGAAQTARYADPDQVARWRSLRRETIEWSRRTGRAAIVIVKERRRLILYERGRAVREYPVELGGNGDDRKLRAGDRATPEGRYRVVARKSGARTRYHKALLLDYPNRDDLRRLAEAKRSGAVAGHVQAGGLIEIHGEGGRGADWTNGCPALSNKHMDELFARVEVGTPVTILGGDGEGPLSELHRTLVGRATDLDASAR